MTHYGPEQPSTAVGLGAYRMLPDLGPASDDFDTLEDWLPGPPGDWGAMIRVTVATATLVEPRNRPLLARPALQDMTTEAATLHGRRRAPVHHERMGRRRVTEARKRISRATAAMPCAVCGNRHRRRWPGTSATPAQP